MSFHGLAREPACRRGEVPRSGLLAQDPADEREERAQKQHRREGKEEAKARAVDDDVPRQVKERPAPDPRPREPEEDEECAERDQQAVHGRNGGAALWGLTIT